MSTAPRTDPFRAVDVWALCPTCDRFVRLQEYNPRAAIPGPRRPVEAAGWASHRIGTANRSHGWSCPTSATVTTDSTPDLVDLAAVHGAVRHQLGALTGLGPSDRLSLLLPHDVVPAATTVAGVRVVRWDGRDVLLARRVMPVARGPR